MRLLFDGEDVTSKNIQLIPASSVKEIILDNYLAAETYAGAGDLLLFILSKLRLRGKIIINSVDAELAAYHLTKGTIDVETFNNLVYEPGSRSILCIDIVESLLKQRVDIESKYIHNECTYSITGVRNG